ncbi:MAG: hypothetical protein ABI349_13960 [Casimicrobiaceae bacterium]
MKNAPQTRANARFAQNPPTRITRLKTLDDVRVELAKIYREARARKLDLTDAKGLAYLLSVLTGLVKDTDIERRITALEGASNAVNAK